MEYVLTVIAFLSAFASLAFLGDGNTPAAIFAAVMLAFCGIFELGRRMVAVREMEAKARIEQLWQKEND